MLYTIRQIGGRRGLEEERSHGVQAARVRIPPILNLRRARTNSIASTYERPKVEA